MQVLNACVLVIHCYALIGKISEGLAVLYLSRSQPHTTSYGIKSHAGPPLKDPAPKDPGTKVRAAAVPKALPSPMKAPILSMES